MKFTGRVDNPNYGPLTMFRPTEHLGAFVGRTMCGGQWASERLLVANLAQDAINAAWERDSTELHKHIPVKLGVIAFQPGVTALLETDRFVGVVVDASSILETADSNMAYVVMNLRSSFEHNR